jgi:NADPH-dependent curcumin reductase
MTTNKQIILASRPAGVACLENFLLIHETLQPLKPGQFRVQHQYLSLDPYMRGRMNEGKSYAEPQPLGQVMIGGTVGRVVESLNRDFSVGEYVVGMGGWQEYCDVDAVHATAWRKVDAQHIDVSHFLGALGMPGVTAWYGLNKIIQAKPGETVTVSAASGAVGGVVGALAKAKGCHVVGIAGGAVKCEYVVQTLGFDACVDYKQHNNMLSLSKALKQSCPNGIDGHFENVGGMVLDAVMLRTNPFARIAVCGMIAGYDGAPLTMANPALILVNRLMMQGFIVSEHFSDWPAALAELTRQFIDNKWRPSQSIAMGLESAPKAFLGLLKGENLGKQLVKLT